MLVKVHGFGVLAVGLCMAAVVLAACFGADEDTTDPVASATATFVPSVIPTSEPSLTPDLSTATPTPEPAQWWTVAETTWNGTFEVTLEIYGSATIARQTELRARTRLRNVSEEPGMFIRWSQFDPAVPLWIVLPRQAAAADAEQRPALRLIQLQAVDDPLPSISSFLEVQHMMLEPGGSIEREALWDLTLQGNRADVRNFAADGVYTLRADFYPEDGLVNPGLPDVVLEFPITLDRDIR